MSETTTSSPLKIKLAGDGSFSSNPPSLSVEATKLSDGLSDELPDEDASVSGEPGSRQRWKYLTNQLSEIIKQIEAETGKTAGQNPKEFLRELKKTNYPKFAEELKILDKKFLGESHTNNSDVE